MYIPKLYIAKKDKAKTAIAQSLLSEENKVKIAEEASEELIAESDNANNKNIEDENANAAIDDGLDSSSLIGN